jgi:hypothetical protein
LTSSAARIAAKVSPATTATASSSATTAMAPGGVDGWPATVPPSVGQCLITAYTMPGTVTSMPKIALPSHFDGMSGRGTDVPIRRSCESGVSAGFAGGVRSAAPAAS